MEISKEGTSTLKSFSEAINYLDEVITVLHKNGHTTEANNACELMFSIVYKRFI